MLREDDSGNIVYTGENNKNIILLQKTKTNTSEYYTLVVPDGDKYATLTEYIDNREKFLEKVEYKPSVEVDDISQPVLQFTFVVGSDKDKTVVNIPIKDLPIEADNIYFTEDLKLTTPFGYYQPGDNGYVDTKTATKKLSVQQFFKDALSREDTDPKIINPSVRFVKPTKNILAELGSKITFDYEVTFDEGKYPYDTTTGVTISAASVKLGSTQINTNNGLEGSHSIAKMGNDSLTLSATIKHTNGNFASSNLENETTKRIQENEITATGITISSYREGFYFRTDKTTKTPTINSVYLRDNSTIKTNKGYSKGVQKRTIPIGTKVIVLAYPADQNGITKILNTTVNADMTNSFIRSDDVVQINDAANGNPKDYKVWTYAPAEAYTTETSLEITLG